MYVSDRRENIERRGENAGYQHILLFPQSFQKPYFVLPRKTMDCLGNVEAKPVSGTVPMHPPCFLFFIRHRFKESGTDQSLIEIRNVFGCFRNNVTFCSIKFGRARYVLCQRLEFHKISKRMLLICRSFLIFSGILFVSFVEDNSTMSSIRYFKNHVCAKPMKVNSTKLNFS